MKKNLEIELLEEHENVNIYTIRYKDEESEFDKFLDKFPNGCEYEEDIDIIIKWIDKIGMRGALERYLRPEGKYKDRLYAIPIETASIRLYVIRISDNIIVIGNGDIKNTQTYNENPNLKSIVEQLQSLDVLIYKRLRTGELQINGKQLIGNLRFVIDI